MKLALCEMIQVSGGKRLVDFISNEADYPCTAPTIEAVRQGFGANGGV